MAQKSTGQFKNRDRFIEIGLAIAYFRKLKGMTQQQLADLAMAQPVTYQFYERLISFVPFHWKSFLISQMLWRWMQQIC